MPVSNHPWLSIKSTIFPTTFHRVCVLLICVPLHTGDKALKSDSSFRTVSLLPGHHDSKPLDTNSEQGVRHVRSQRL